MRTLFNPADRDAILQRLDSLTPRHAPQWGGMNAPQMIRHVSTGLRLGLEEKAPRHASGLTAHAPFNWLVIHVIPWPKGVKTAPELLAEKPGEWDADIQNLRTLITEFSRQEHRPSWPENIIFGRISGKSWGALMHRHLDHHLTQFGV